LQGANHMSLQKGCDEDEEQTMQQLRLALIDCYISILHGLNEIDDEDHNINSYSLNQQANNTFIEPHARAIHQYLESLLSGD